ncbi:MAG: cytochrome c [Rhodocyclales bacterium]|jgi:mono/diheme cytochrome c family protein|nr:cytochrome c [Rhodocyclales bacterium]
MTRMFAALLVLGLAGTEGAIANEGKRLYDDFRCIACHGSDGKGTDATVKAAKAIAGTQSEVTYESIMKMVSSGSPTHSPGSCDVLPTREQVKAISDYVAGLPR